GAGILATLGSLGERGVDQCPRPVDLVGVVEFRQEQSVQLLPDASLIPQPQIVAAGFATAAAQFGWQVVPGDAGLEDEEDAGEGLAVIQGFTAGEAEAALRRG